MKGGRRITSETSIPLARSVATSITQRTGRIIGASQDMLTTAAGMQLLCPFYR